MRIVLDTNVLVSGLLSPFGAPAQIVRMLATGDVVLSHDARILAEYREVLFRPKFSFSAESIETLLDQIVSSGLTVAATPLKTRLPDHDDEPFLEVALCGGAEALVTGNLKHYPRGKRQGAVVLLPAEFLQRFRALEE